MSENGSGLWVGAEVVTRRGKFGTVVSVNEDGTYGVRFGGRVFDMKAGQLVHARVYRRMGKHSKGMTNQF